ncbi:MAG TPA: hypothetical protein VH351_15175 [Bryobacteraceae bacterium]|jgi:hypothetical protein|nr:hypothetical protein [Bryobacteraceae bacterium]
MKINPDSPDFQRQVESTTTPPKSGTAFGETLTSKTQPTVATGNTPVPAAKLSKQDSTDPVKVNAAIHLAVQELIEKEFGGMCTPDRERIAAWLRSDPMMRAALLQRLTSST